MVKETTAKRESGAGNQGTGIRHGNLARELGNGNQKTAARKTAIRRRESEKGQRQAKRRQRRKRAQETSVGKEPAYAADGQLKRDGTQTAQSRGRSRNDDRFNRVNGARLD
jgi:hypothetical protein